MLETAVMESIVNVATATVKYLVEIGTISKLDQKIDECTVEYLSHLGCHARKGSSSWVLTRVVHLSILYSVLPITRVKCVLFRTLATIAFRNLSSPSISILRPSFCPIARP